MNLNPVKYHIVKRRTDRHEAALAIVSEKKTTIFTRPCFEDDGGEEVSVYSVAGRTFVSNDVEWLNRTHLPYRRVWGLRVGR
jgi:hypothetical protein